MLQINSALVVDRLSNQYFHNILTGSRHWKNKMERKLLYAFRGWIAFVAFMDLGTAFRSYIEKRSFLGDPSDAQFMAGKFLSLSTHFPVYYITIVPIYLNAVGLTNAVESIAVNLNVE